jgi:hypothetical protein
MKKLALSLVIAIAIPATAGAVELYTFVEPCDLILVDTEAGTYTNLGPLGDPPYWSVEAMDHGPNGLLYATLEQGCFTHGNAHRIGTIDPETMEVTILSDLRPRFNDVDAIAFSPEGRLFGISVATTELIEINPLTGFAVPVGPLGLEFPTFVGAIEFLPDGTLVGIDMINWWGEAPCEYLTIDPSTGAATLTGYVGFTGIEGMSLGLDGHLYALANSMEWYLDAVLVRVDSSTGAGTQVQVLDVPGPRDALYAVSFPEVLIDVKPGSYPSCFNINGAGVVPVAVLGNETFDVAMIDPTTLVFGGMPVKTKKNMVPQCGFEDTNFDGWIDLVCKFVDDPLLWSPGDGYATLTGNLHGGAPFMGSDEICLTQ